MYRFRAFNTHNLKDKSEDSTFLLLSEWQVPLEHFEKWRKLNELEFELKNHGFMKQQLN